MLTIVSYYNSPPMVVLLSGSGKVSVMELNRKLYMHRYCGQLFDEETVRCFLLFVFFLRRVIFISLISLYSVLSGNFAHLRHLMNETG